MSTNHNRALADKYEKLINCIADKYREDNSDDAKVRIVRTELPDAIILHVKFGVFDQSGMLEAARLGSVNYQHKKNLETVRIFRVGRRGFGPSNALIRLDTKKNLVSFQRSRKIAQPRREISLNPKTIAASNRIKGIIPALAEKHPDFYIKSALHRLSDAWQGRAGASELFLGVDDGNYNDLILISHKHKYTWGHHELEQIAAGGSLLIGKRIYGATSGEYVCDGFVGGLGFVGQKESSPVELATWKSKLTSSDFASEIASERKKANDRAYFEEASELLSQEAEFVLAGAMF